MQWAILSRPSRGWQTTLPSAENFFAPASSSLPEALSPRNSRSPVTSWDSNWARSAESNCASLKQTSGSRFDRLAQFEFLHLAQRIFGQRLCKHHPSRMLIARHLVVEQRKHVGLV